MTRPVAVNDSRPGAGKPSDRYKTVIPKPRRSDEKVRPAGLRQNSEIRGGRRGGILQAAGKFGKANGCFAGNGRRRGRGICHFDKNTGKIAGNMPQVFPGTVSEK